MGVFLPGGDGGPVLDGSWNEEFEDDYDYRYADRHGTWRPRVETVVDRCFDHGDPREGFARVSYALRVITDLSLVARASACAVPPVSCAFRHVFKAGHLSLTNL